MIAQPRLVVPPGHSGNLEVPGTSEKNGYSVIIMEDGSLLAKVTLVKEGSVIASPEFLLEPNSEESMELGLHDHRITVAVKNTAEDAFL